jgi:hypothetical protein
MSLMDDQQARVLHRRREARARIIEQIELYWTEHDRGPNRIVLARRAHVSEALLKPLLDEMRDEGIVTWDYTHGSLRLKH